MADQVQMYNRGMNLLGLEPISSVTEDNKRTKSFNAAFAMIVPELMHQEPWRFTVKEQTLAQLTVEGIKGYDNAFRYPADCIAVLYPVNEKQLDIQILGDIIYSNAESLTLRYVKNEQDLGKWTTGFAKCVSYLLAIESCYNLIESNKREESLINIYDARVLPQAIATDALQQLIRQENNELVEVASAY